MSNGVVRFTKRGSVASVVFDRPEARNAIIMAMYDQACYCFRDHRY